MIAQEVINNSEFNNINNNHDSCTISMCELGMIPEISLNYKCFETIGQIKKYHNSIVNSTHSVREYHRISGGSISLLSPTINSHPSFKVEEQGQDDEIIKDSKDSFFSSPVLLNLCQYTKSKINKPARIIFAEDLI
jgi:hypothetical protein